MNLITTIEGLYSAIEEIKEGYTISFDVETTGLDMVSDKLVGIGFANRHDEWYFDLDTYVKDGLEVYEKATEHSMLSEAWELMVEKQLFDMDNHLLIAHNAPFDLWFVARDIEHYTGHPFSLIYEFVGRCLDTLSLATVVDENLVGTRMRFGGKLHGALGLKSLSRIFLNREPREWDENFMEWTVQERAEYCGDDVRNTYDLASLFTRVLKSRGMLEYYFDYVAPMSTMTLMMEREGMKVDVPKLLKVQKELDEKLKKYTDALEEVVSPPPELVFRSSNYTEGTSTDVREYFEDLVPLLEEDYDLDEFYTKAGNLSVSAGNLEIFHDEFPDEEIWDKGIMSEQETEFNPNSRQQLIDYFLEQGYRLPLTENDNYSVNEAALDTLQETHPDDPIWEPLSNRRRLHKLKSTYVDNILNCAWEDDRVHPDWNQAGTVTGRYSCSSSQKYGDHPRGPALQTIPRPGTVESGDWEYNPRKWFIAGDGYTMAVADYAQAEVRMMAVMSRDKNLIEAIQSGQDMHSQIAAQVFKRKWAEADDEERKELRQKSKMVTFGTMYGIGPGSLSERLDITYKEGQEILDDFYGAFPGVAEWKKEVSFKLGKQGYVESFFGRRRSPIFSTFPPRITAKPHTDEFEKQKMHYKLWQMEQESEARRSKIDLNEADERELQGRAERQAVNFLIQGSVADLLNVGLITLVKKGYTIIGQVHDEVILEFGEDTEEETVERDIKSAFEAEIEGVPFIVDVHFGDSWACGKE